MAARRVTFVPAFSGNETETANIPMVFASDGTGYPSVFMDHAIDLVCEAYNRDILDVVNTPLITPEEVRLVEFSQTLGNWRALVATDRNDGRYYQLLYDAKRKETHVNVYRRIGREVIPDSDRRSAV